MRLLPWVWIVCGIAAIAIGIVTAVQELGAMYEHLTTDPLAEPEYDEKTERPRRMLTALGFGAGGLVPLGIGTVLLHRSRARRRRLGR